MILSRPLTTKERSLFWQRLAYSVLIFGVFVDHLSSRIALTHPDIFETNTFVIWIMHNKIWLPVDVVFTVLTILTCRWICNNLRDIFPNIDTILIFPIIVGLGRYTAGVWNCYTYLLYRGWIVITPPM